MTLLLNHSMVQAPGSAPDRVGFVLHGILGSLGNWRSFSRRLVARCPRWKLVLVDLRNHGASTPARAPHTLQSCAEDLVRLAQHMGEEPELVMGHSYGGKVALAYGALAAPRQVLCLDSTPGAWPDSRSDSSDVAQVIAALRQVPQPLARRSELVEQLNAMGFSPMIGQWMTTNLTRTPDGLRWKFDLDAVHQMLLDYAQQDLWPWLESPDRRSAVTVVRAAQSDRWRPHELRRFSGPKAAPLQLLTLPDAGHWLHVDNPDGLLELLVQQLQG